MKVRVHLEINCPNCGHAHTVPVGGDGNNWTWNGNYEKPTVTPSLKVAYPPPFPGAKERVLCHFVLTDGILHYQDDFEGPLKGQSVPAKEIFT